MTFSKLYEILGVNPQSSQADITKAFRIRALKVHPDKNPNDATANEKFQLLQSAFDTLKDPKKRQRYDSTGCTEEDSPDFEEAYEKFRTSFVEITEETIESFAASYKCSDDEAEDVANFYEKFNGDLTLFFDFVPLSEPSECGRFLELIQRLVADGRLESTRRFTLTSEKFESIAERWRKKHEKESQQSSKRKVFRSASGDASGESGSSSKKRRSEDQKGGHHARKDNVEDFNSLVLAIKGNQNHRGSKISGMLDKVIDKVATEASLSSDVPPPPTESDFQAAKNRLFRRSKELKNAGKRKAKKAFT